jgi:hypothetical protein
VLLTISCLQPTEPELTEAEAEEDVGLTLSHMRGMENVTVKVSFVTDPAFISAVTSNVVEGPMAQDMHRAMRNALGTFAPNIISDGTRSIPCDLAA